MKIIMHGAAREVGRSCIELQSKQGSRFLLDCGLKLTELGTEYPVGLDQVSSLRAVFLSHAHLDHTGALPLFDHQGMRCPIIATPTTKALTRLLLEDALKIGRLQHAQLGYEQLDIDKALACMSNVQFNESGTIDGVPYQYFDAGHIPGSSSIVLALEKKRLLYTGDYNPQETLLMHGGSQDFDDVDIMITESTYGDRNHLPRAATERRFLQRVEDTLALGGKVLVPSFAVGRAQEMLLLLARKDWGVPIYIDGMALEATQLLLEHSDSLKEADKLREALRKVHQIRRGERRKILSKQSIVITTSGMLTGGPILEYIKHAHSDVNSAILLTGYQAEHTNGRLLIDKHHVYIDGWKTAVKCAIEQFDFSAHAGAGELKSVIRKISPHTLVVQHGDPAAVEHMRLWAAALGFDVRTPSLNEVVLID
ncbi:MBL fold metallo-hydrolase [Candidatus Woesearchaeota archaeon]|nr:MBL fold metallo-hydrolase [Candidatus Woesearchaeota archaeon]